MEPTIKRSLWVSFGLALMASVAAYFLTFFLFTIHEEIGISTDAALPIAGCIFPSCFWVASLAIWSRTWVGAAGDGTKVPAMERQPRCPPCRSDSSPSGATHGTANSR